MASMSLFALLDDIATVLDDVAMMTKVAAKKSAGVLGDDLALNAQQVSGVSAERELPVVWAVAKGSFLNKLILVPLALALSLYFPAVILFLLMLGGAYLCYEGFEKVFHTLTSPSREAEKEALLNAVSDPKVNLVDYERQKIKGAIRTDFILSAEIIVIALGTVGDAKFITQALVVSTIALIMTIGVYGLVAGIVKLDDAGLYLLKRAEQNRGGRMQVALGNGLVNFAPKLMKFLVVVGTAAMFLVGGGIIAHNTPLLADAMHHLHHEARHLAILNLSMSELFADLFAGVMSILGNAIIGIIVGGIVVCLVAGVTLLYAFFFAKAKLD